MPGMSVVNLSRRRSLGLLAAAAAWPRPAAAADVRQFTIATGDLAGTYYPLGAVIANVLTAPPGGERCRQGELCGVPGLVAVALTSEGSVANLESLAAGHVDSAFAQADVADAARTGRDIFAGAPLTELRAVASLYPEVVQLVVRKGLDHPLRRLAAGAERSGTRLSAPIVLPAFGIDPEGVELVDLNLSDALRAMRAGELDAFLTIAGPPTTAVAEATAGGDMRLLSVVPEAARQVAAERASWRLTVIPAGTYADVDAVASLSVPALWLVRAELDVALVQAMLATLWSAAARDVLDAAHPAARQVTLVNALSGISVPLHEGAVDFYRGAGILAMPTGVPHSDG